MEKHSISTGSERLLGLIFLTMLASGHFLKFPYRSGILPYGYYSDFTLTKELIQRFLTEGYPMKCSIFFYTSL